MTNTNCFCVDQLNHLINTDKCNSPKILATYSMYQQYCYYVKKMLSSPVKIANIPPQPLTGRLRSKLSDTQILAYLNLYFFIPSVIVRESREQTEVDCVFNRFTGQVLVIYLRFGEGFEVHGFRKGFLQGKHHP